MIWLSGYFQLRIMSINKQELIRHVCQKINQEEKEIEAIIDTFLAEIYQSLKQGESVNLRNFGTFYIQRKYSGTVFKFNRAQRLRKLFG